MSRQSREGRRTSIAGRGNTADESTEEAKECGVFRRKKKIVVFHETQRGKSSSERWGCRGRQGLDRGGQIEGRRGT